MKPLLLLLSLLVAGCTSSPATRIEHVTITTLIAGEGCYARRGHQTAAEAAQEARGEAQGSAAGGQGRAALDQAGALSGLLSSEVGC